MLLFGRIIISCVNVEDQDVLAERFIPDAPGRVNMVLASILGDEGIVLEAVDVWSPERCDKLGKVSRFGKWRVVRSVQAAAAVSCARAVCCAPMATHPVLSPFKAGGM